MPPREFVDGEDDLLRLGAEAIERMNRRYGPGPSGNRFLLLYRRRLFNAGENVWMGWERKRGKLHELNRLLRGASRYDICRRRWARARRSPPACGTS